MGLIVPNVLVCGESKMNDIFCVFYAITFCISYELNKIINYATNARIMNNATVL